MVVLEPNTSIKKPTIDILINIFSVAEMVNANVSVTEQKFLCEINLIYSGHLLGNIFTLFYVFKT